MRLIPDGIYLSISVNDFSRILASSSMQVMEQPEATHDSKAAESNEDSESSSVEMYGPLLLCFHALLMTSCCKQCCRTCSD